MVFGQKCMFPKLERGVPGTEHNGIGVPYREHGPERRQRMGNSAGQKHKSWCGTPTRNKTHHDAIVDRHRLQQRRYSHNLAEVLRND